LSVTERAHAQIYEPEGLNMPGAWDSWTNPPGNLALASATQVPGGRVTRIATGVARWQTIFSVKATGGDLTGGTYAWIFTSGPTTNYYQNKWAAVTVIMDTLQMYTKEGGTDNNITLLNDKWYTMNWEDIGYSDCHAIFMQTSNEPVQVLTVSTPASIAANAPATISLTISAAKSPEEHVYLRYSMNAFATSYAAEATMTGTSGTAQIPGYPDGTVVEYYAFTSTESPVQDNFDLYTIHFQNNGGTNYTYTVGSGPSITFANLQSPDTTFTSAGMAFDVFGRVGIPGVTGQATPAAGVEAWVGVSADNTDPSAWTSWYPATYHAQAGTYDEYVYNLGILAPGHYYFTTRFRYNGGGYQFGGYSVSGGGFWNGTTNISGVVDVFTGMDDGDHIVSAIFPNPAKDVVCIDLRQEALVTLQDIHGKKHSVSSLKAGLQSLELRGFSPGVYFIRVTTGNSTIIRKFVKE
jgi:hypothetical protein